MERSGRDPQVQVITDARRSHTDDLDQRVRRYLISMGIRTVCVVLVVVVDGWLRWVFAVGAIGLPYLAVVMANARGDRRSPAPLEVPTAPLPGLPAAPRTPAE